MKKIILLLDLYGIFMAVFFTGLLATTFFSAYSTDSKSITIYIDNFGEALPEFIALIIVLPIVIFSTTRFFIKRLNT